MIHTEEQKAVLKKFKTIPWIGPACAQDLWDLGLRSFDDLASSDPEYLYKRLCVLQKAQVDRCMLYVFRYAVYYVSEPNPDPKLLKWWNWKDSSRKSTS